MVSVACPSLLTYAFHVTFSLYYGSLWQSCCVLWTRVVYISYGTVSWCPLHFCHTCSFSSIQPLLVLLDRSSGFAIFTCGFIIIWHYPMVYVASPSSLSILHHHPCSADSHLSGFTFATMSCWADLVVLPQIHVDSLSFSFVSLIYWNVFKIGYNLVYAT